MRTKRFMLAVAVILALCGIAAFAQEPLASQKGQVKTDSKMAYHHGPIVTGVPNVYFIWYGTWDNNADNTAVQFILTDFPSNLGGTPNGIDVGAIAKQSDN